MLIKLLLSTILVSSTIAQNDKFQEILRWKTIDLNWPSDEKRTRAHERNEYVPANNQISGIKIWKDNIYLTIPRWRDGVPVTLGVTPMITNVTETGPKLNAYPNWEMQKLDDCRAFQFVRGMEIDPLGRMWVLDTGRTDILTLEPKPRCPPRLVILDLENGGQVLRSYNFPEEVAPRNTSYLYDIVLDHEDGGFAYISDSSDVDPGIIVFSLANRTSWKIRDLSMRAQIDAVKLTVGKVDLVRERNVDSIALSSASAQYRYVYYAPLSSFHLYALRTWILKSRAENVHPYVYDVGEKDSQTDGMMMSNTGVLYYGLLANDSVAMWMVKSNCSLTINQRYLPSDHEKMQWVDTFAFDDMGYLYCLTNSLQNFIVEKVNTNHENFRVMRLETPGLNSYQYYANGTAPELPVIIAGVNRAAVSLDIFFFFFLIGFFIG